MSQRFWSKIIKAEKVVKRFRKFMTQFKIGDQRHCTCNPSAATFGKPTPSILFTSKKYVFRDHTPGRVAGHRTAKCIRFRRKHIDTFLRSSLDDLYEKALNDALNT